MTGVPKPEVQRHLKAMRANGIVRRDERLAVEWLEPSEDNSDFSGFLLDVLCVTGRMARRPNKKA